MVGFVALFSIISSDSQSCFHFDKLHTKLTFEGSQEETDDDFRIDHIALNGDDDDMSIES